MYVPESSPQSRYMDKDLLKQLPQCDGDDKDLCDIDPSKLLLEHVSRHFHGNFSCIGMNAAGPSPMSEPIELVVLYPPGTAFKTNWTKMINDRCPGNATLVRSSEEVVKGSEFTLTCLVPDLGRPRALLYKWSLGDHIVNHVTTETWTINPVTLETQVLLPFACIPSQRKLILPSSLLSTTICIIVSGMIATMEETWTIKLVTVETQGVATLLIPEHTVETIQHNIKQYHTLRVPP